MYLILGLLIRFLLISLDYSFDLNNHLSWAQDLVNRGFPGFYETVSKEVYSSLYPNYPPLILDIFYGFYQLKKPIVDLFWWLNLHLPIFPSKVMYFLEKREFLLVLMKLPAIIFDIAIFYLLYLFAKKVNPKRKNNKLLVALFILFNPIFIYLSSLWGQVESVNLFFIFASLYLLVYSRQAVASLILFALSLLVKPTGLIFLPVYLVYFFKKFGSKKLLLSVVAANVAFFLVYLPFYKTGNIFLFPYMSYWQKVVDALALSYVSNSAFNFWSILPALNGVRDQSLFLNFISYRVLGLVIVGVFYVLIIKRFLAPLRGARNDTGPEKRFYHSLFLTAYAFIMFSTRMHERYFVYLLPLLFLIAIKEKRYFFWLMAMSVLVFANVYYAWSIPYNDFILGLKNSLTVAVLSFINLLVFFKLLFKMNR